MNNSTPTIEELFRPMLGIPCWQVKRGYGSFLTFEFGDPSLVIREPREAPDASLRVSENLTRRLVTVRGQWHLWIYCCNWHIRQHGVDFAHDESDDDSIAAACQELDGQVLTEVVIGPNAGWTQFCFDLGGELTTRPYNRETKEHWMLYGPDSYVFTYRSDGVVSFGPANQTPDEQQWIVSD